MGYPTGNEVVLPVVQGNLLILSFVDDMSGEQYVSVTAENANGSETTGFTVSVGVVNDGPVLKAIENMTIPEDEETIVVLYADDPDSTPDDMVFTAESDNTFISAATEGRQLMLKPEPDWIGTANITIMVSDGFSSDSSTFTVAVADMNEMPVIFGAMNAEGMETPGLSTPKGKAIEISLENFVVADADTPDQSGFSLEIQSGENYTVSGNMVIPSSGFKGDLSVPVVVNDGTDDSEPFDLTLKVGNMPPMADAGPARKIMEDGTAKAWRSCLGFRLGRWDNLSVEADRRNSGDTSQSQIVSA